MNRAEAVKLISLEIKEFLQLQPGIVKWKLESSLHLNVIDVAKQSQLFQAFQFVFGAPTMAKQAKVIVSLRQNEQRTINFLRSKLTNGLHTCGIRIDGIDEYFRMVEQSEYIGELVKLKVFASTMVFMFGDDLLPGIDHDLRHYLEKHLLKNPDVLNDYAENNKKIETLFEQKTSIASTTVLVNGLLKSIANGAENRESKASAAVGERDFKVLQVFDHYKKLETLSQEENDIRHAVASTPNTDKEEVVEELKKWDAKMDEYPKRQLAIEASKGCFFSLMKRCRKEIESQQAKVESLKVLDATLSSTSNGKMIQSEIELEDARVKFKQAEIDKKISEISARWDTRMRTHENIMENVRENIEKVRGKELIKICPLDRFLVEETEELKKRFHDMSMNTSEDFDEEPYVFRVPTVHSRNKLRPFMSRLPLNGTFMVKTPDLKTHKLISWMLENEYRANGQRSVTIVSCDPNDKRPYNMLPLQATVDVKIKMASNTIPMDSVTSELCDSTKKIETKQYIIGKKSENIIQNRDDGSKSVELLQHKEKYRQVQQNMAAQYLIDHDDLFLQMPNVDKNNSETVINVVKTWKQCRNLSVKNRKQIEAMIKDLESQLAAFKEKERQFNRLEQHMNELMENLEALEMEGGKIRNDIKNVVAQEVGPSTIVSQMAMAESLRLTIDCLKIQLTKWDLPFDLAQETSPDAYYDCLSPQNKPILDRSVDESWSADKSAVALMMDEIQEELSEVQENDYYLKCFDELISLKKECSNQQRAKVKQMVELKSIIKKRNEIFEPYFLEFKHCFDRLVDYCRPQWAVHSELIAADDNSALDEPIRLLVDDRQLDHAFTYTMTLNHSVAAFILHLAMNITCGSQFIIIDGLNRSIEPCLIPLIMALLEKISQDYGIQVIFMKLKPEDENMAEDTKYTWSDEKNFEQIADTTSIVVGEDVEMTDSEQSRMVIQSAHSSTGASSPN